MLAYILTASSEDHKGQHYLRFFGRSEIGPFEVIITDFKPYLYVEKGVKLASCKVRYTITDSQKKNIFNEPLEKVVFNTQREHSAFRRYLENNSLQSYEADIRSHDRYLMENSIYATVEIQNEKARRTKKSLTQFINPTLVPSSRELGFSLSTLSFDIETSKAGEIISAAFHYKSQIIEKKLALIQSADKSLKSEDYLILAFDSERPLIENIISTIAKWDPDLIIGWNVVGFDFNFILKRCKHHNINPIIGRNDSLLTITKSYYRNTIRSQLNGRVILDIDKALRHNFFHFESYALDNVAHDLLGERKLIDHGVDKWSEIERMYKEEPIRLLDYNVGDTDLVTKIVDETKILDLLVARSRISGLLLNRVGISTAAFDHMFIPAFNRAGFVINNVDDVDYSESAKGGYVFEPEVGLWEHVVCLDFKSLYPSIISTFKIDPLSRIESHLDTIKTPEGYKFSKTHHILPGVIDRLLLERAQAKKQRNGQLSQAIKILMNSFYGVMGSGGCRFYHEDLPHAITSTGRFILKHSQKWLSDNGFRVLYGDTDSLFIMLQKDNNSDYELRGKNLAYELNEYLKSYIKENYALDSKLEIEYEKYYSKFFLPSSRSQAGGSKKRYAGLLKMGGFEEVVFTGMEFVRSDWTLAAKNFQKGLYERIFFKKPYREWMRAFVKDLWAGKMNSDLVYKKRLTKPVDEYIRNIPPHVKAAKIFIEKTDVLDVRRISYVITPSGPWPASIGELSYDYNHYVEKQIKPIADDILQFLDESFNDVINGKQRSLFDL